MVKQFESETSELVLMSNHVWEIEERFREIDSNMTMEEHIEQMAVEEQQSKSVFKVAEFAELMYQACNNVGKNRIKQWMVYEIFCDMFKEDFEEELSQCPEVLDVLLWYEDKYYETNNDKQSFEVISVPEQRQAAGDLKYVITQLFPLKPYKQQMEYCRELQYYFPIGNVPGFWWLEPLSPKDKKKIKAIQEVDEKYSSLLKFN